MISLIQEPGPINLLCDEIKLSFVTDGRLQTPGAKAGVSVYASPVNMPANTYLQFVWDGITERITFVANPDTSGNQCKLLTTGNFSTWDSVYLAEALRANYNIANVFAISNNPGAHTVTLTAITAGAKGLVVTKTSGSTGLTLSAVTAGTDPVYRENYGIVVQTFAAGYNNVWRKVSEDRLTPNSAGSAEADFGELLRKETSPAFAWPAGQAITPRVGMTTKFYFKYGEIWDNDPQQLYKTVEYKGIWGGLPRAAHAKLDNIMADWWMSFKASKKFLTNMPAYVPTTISSPQRLYWLCMDAGLTAVFIKVKSWNVGGIDDVTMATISSMAPISVAVLPIWNRPM